MVAQKSITVVVKLGPKTDETVEITGPDKASLDLIEKAIRRGVRRIGPTTYVVW